MGPEGPLLVGRGGYLYGTAGDDDQVAGTVFRMVRSGNTWIRRTIFTFDYQHPENSGYPKGQLVQDSKGNIYGVLSGRGRAPDFGAVYRLAPPLPHTTNWRLTILHRFTDPHGLDGRSPGGGLLLQEQDGKITLYGSAPNAGRFDSGLIFSITL
jgi:hypothetical protein